LTPHGRLFLIPALGALAACAGRGATNSSPPRTIDPALEAEAIDLTATDQPLQIIFDWSLQDRDARFSGQGVARVEPPGRARVDLFGPRGEGYVSAVLDGEQLRFPPGVQNVPLPPPGLFWSVLGVFRPPAGATLNGAERRGETIELQYAQADDVWRFRLNGANLAQAEWTGSGEGRRTVVLDGEDPSGVPRQATYRDWPAFLELRLSPTEVRKVDGFPSDIWTLTRSRD
jgi:hypothetical protein